MAVPRAAVTHKPAAPSLRDAQVRLVSLWLIGIAPTFLLLTTRTLYNWRIAAQDVWAWFSPNAVPTLSLIVGGYLAVTRVRRGREQLADTFVYRMTFVISAMYLLTILTLVLVTASSNVWAALDTFRTANLPLGILQGLVAASLGYFFVSPEKG